MGTFQCPKCPNSFKAVISDVIRRACKLHCGCYKKPAKVNEIKIKVVKPKIEMWTNHPLYSTWMGMRKRCYNPNHINYKNYGARGITMSSEFKNSFETWLEYISSLDGFAELHKNNLEIDRIDNNKGYERGNLRIVDRATNSNNTRKRLDNKSGYTGVYFDKRTEKWYGEIISNSKKVYLGSYSTPMECAKARDTYIVDNNLDNKKNLI